MWLISISILFSRFIHIVVFHQHFVLSNTPLYVYIQHVLFIQSSADGHLGCFHLLATVKDATMNTCYKCLPEFLFSIILGIILAIAGSCGTFTLTFLRHCRNIFHKYCTILYSHQQCTKSPVFFPLCPSLVYSGLGSSSQYSYMFATLSSVLGR